MDVGNLISGSSAFSKSSLNIWKFSVYILLKLNWKDFEHYLVSSSEISLCEICAICIIAMWNECDCIVVGTFFGIALLCSWNENWPFPVLWVFQICWHIECSSFTASSCRIWNSSTGIPSPPLVLFVVILPMAHFTSHSRMSGPRWVWVISPSWLSGWWRSFLYSSSVCSCHLFFIYSASVRSLPFLSFIESMFTWNVPLVSLIFLKRSLVFPILSFSSISLLWLLGKAFLSLLVLLWNSAFKWVYLFFSPLLLASLLFTAVCKAFSDSHFAFLHFFFLEIFLTTASCTMSWTSVHRSSGTLSDLIPWICLSLPLYNHKGFYLGHTWMVLWFSLLSSV